MGVLVGDDEPTFFFRLFFFFTIPLFRLNMRRNSILFPSMSNKRWRFSNGNIREGSVEKKLIE